MVKNSKQQSLNPREFEHLIEGIHNINCNLQKLECKLITFLGGRLGMRPGEITHLREDWINWRRGYIKIPLHDPCDMGTDGGLCGSCRQSVRQRMKYHDMTLAEARMEILRNEMFHSANIPSHIKGQIRATHLGHINSTLSEEVLEEQIEHLLRSSEEIDNHNQVLNSLNSLAEEYKEENELTRQDAEELLWSPKTENGAREIYFDWCPRAEIVLEDYFERFDEWTNSQTCITRRMEKMLEKSPNLDDDATTPHGLRATAATYLAGKGLSATALQSHFGWSDIQTAERYIADSPKATHSQLLETRSR